MLHKRFRVVNKNFISKTEEMWSETHIATQTV